MSVFVCKRHFWWRRIWRHLHVTMLQCGAKFSTDLVPGSIAMSHAKNYETVPKFVKVMARILWPLFSRTRCRPNAWMAVHCMRDNLQALHTHTGLLAEHQFCQLVNDDGSEMLVVVASAAGTWADSAHHQPRWLITGQQDYPYWISLREQRQSRSN